MTPEKATEEEKKRRRGEGQPSAAGAVTLI
jgi:hypothetical protein